MESKKYRKKSKALRRLDRNALEKIVQIYLGKSNFGACPFSNYLKTYALDTFQDFLIKLDIKPLIHLLEISIFSLNNVILRLTKIMNRADKNRAHF